MVVARKNYGTKKWTPKPTHATNIPSCSSVQLTIQVGKKTWLTNSWVGRLGNLEMLDRLEEEFM